MRIALTGASGFIGTELKKSLRADGHELRVLVRRPPNAPDERHWDPDLGRLGADVLADVDAVVNLSGAGVGDHRWTSAYKNEILMSRLNSTSTLARTMAELGSAAPKVFLSASAVGYYGDTGDRVVDETAPSGNGFLADVCRQWEDATEPAQRSGDTRVVHLRTGLVLSATGGLLKRLRLVVKLGAGGKLGSGQQYQPWIALSDEIGAIKFLLAAPVSGAVNLSGPDPVTQQHFVRALAAVLHRPAILPAPAFALRLALGQFADEGVLAGQRAVPSALLNGGYTFAHPTLDGALQAALHDTSGQDPSGP